LYRPAMGMNGLRGERGKRQTALGALCDLSISAGIWARKRLAGANERSGDLPGFRSSGNDFTADESKYSIEHL